MGVPGLLQLGAGGGHTGTEVDPTSERTDLSLGQKPWQGPGQQLEKSTLRGGWAGVP